ncbi:hypothetical protein AVDCRST_MAG84-5541 [uncultured Microcoleus sp.]|uniref:Uncharacterized protein n=1 Tax=uncultured Microcoleus sp. TaxID=259945 RepID=A0A6J4NN73_9CYAN|nr:hypothetical protein AVDCRST_MAG84-5541 [uncultured Microcoleus sp.]
MLQLTAERAGNPRRSTWGGTGLRFGERFCQRQQSKDLRFTPQMNLGS